jgi:hypothetical protein
MNQSSMNFANIAEPYLPPLPKQDKYSTYTLVLDLDETLVHYVNVGLLLIIHIDRRYWGTDDTSWGRKIYRRNGEVL